MKKSIFPSFKNFFKDNFFNLVNTLIASLALYFAYYIPYDIFTNEQKLNLQWISNLFTYDIIWNVVTKSWTTEWHIEISKGDLLNFLSTSLDKMEWITPAVFNEKCNTIENSGAVRALWHVQQFMDTNNYYDALLTYLSNNKRNINNSTGTTIEFPLCNGDLFDNHIDYFHYYDCLRIIINNCTH